MHYELIVENKGNTTSQYIHELLQEIIKLYYIDGKTMKEIGIKFDVSEGRVSQLIKEYLGQMRKCCDKLAA